MPITESDFTPNFRLFDAQTKLEQALDLLQALVQETVRDPIPWYVVILLPDGRYVSMVATVLLRDLNAVLEATYKLSEKNKLLATSLGDLMTEAGAPPVEMSDPDYWPGMKPYDSLPTRSQVVVSEGEVRGVLPKSSVVRGERTFGSAPKTSPEAQPSKKINLQVFEGKNLYAPDKKPLQLRQIYALEVSIGDEALVTSIIQDAILKYQWKDEEQEVRLSVHLQSDDFDVPDGHEELVVPRKGESNKVRFDFRARREGRCGLNVLFYKDDLFIQLITLKFTIVDGDLYTYDISGRVLDAAFSTQPRNLNLTLLEGVGGFQLILDGKVEDRVRLPITKDNLAQEIAALRKTLRDQIVYMQDGGRYVYQMGVKIDDAYRQKALPILAKAGYDMYRLMFFSPEADEKTRALGEVFREKVRSEDKLKIQIFSQHFMMPWGLLYMAAEDEFDLNDVHPEWFLGMRHIIEHIPLWQSMQMQVTDSMIDSQAGLTVSLNVNKTIDQQMRTALVAPQLAYWHGLEASGKIKVVERSSAQALLQAMSTTQETTDQVVYFYCHASSKDLTEGGPDLSTMVFGPNDRLTLGLLKQNAPYTRLLPGEPLVFINACESAELSPLFYDGFVPYFLAKGARGVIGTECETPAIFAVEWARRFFSHFLAGEAVGEVVLSLRKEFYEQEGNILGMLYALYVDADTRVGLAITM
jgi:hypothetical protein